MVASKECFLRISREAKRKANQQYPDEPKMQLSEAEKALPDEPLKEYLDRYMKENRQE